jgi:hypothetical protein
VTVQCIYRGGCMHAEACVDYCKAEGTTARNPPQTSKTVNEAFEEWFTAVWGPLYMTSPGRTQTVAREAFEAGWNARSAPETNPEPALDPRMVAACKALQEILDYEGHYATDKNPSIRAIKRIAQQGLAGSQKKTNPKPVCETCGTELAFEDDVCGLCFPVAQP